MTRARLALLLVPLCVGTACATPTIPTLPAPTAALSDDELVLLTGGKLKVRFKAPATTTASLTANASQLDDGRYSVECVNQDGDVLISGTAEVA